MPLWHEDSPAVRDTLKDDDVDIRNINAFIENVDGANHGDLVILKIRQDAIPLPGLQGPPLFRLEQQPEPQSALVSIDPDRQYLTGLSLGLDYALTSSCYDPAPGGEACGRCDACLLRLKGFAEAGTPDPIRYRAGERVSR